MVEGYRTTLCRSIVDHEKLMAFDKIGEYSGVGLAIHTHSSVVVPSAGSTLHEPFESCFIHTLCYSQ